MEFEASSTFSGAREGCVFKLGEKGLGYYADSSPLVAPDGAPVCEGCGLYMPDLLRCTGCKAATYCSSTCQKVCWKAHRKECKKIAKEVGLPGPQKKKPVEGEGAEAPKAQSLRESMGLGRDVAYKDWKNDEKDVLVRDFALNAKDQSSIAGVHRSDPRVNAFMTNSGKFLTVMKDNLPAGIFFTWDKSPLPASTVPYLPLPEMDLRLRAGSDGKFIHLAMIPLREMGPEDHLPMLPTLEPCGKDEPKFRAIVCDTSQSPPQLMLPHAMPDFATCGQSAPDDGLLHL
jgi:hypothetical protein